MRSRILTLTLVCLLSDGAQLCSGAPNTRFVDANSPFFQYLGAWQTNSTGRFTIYPGSQVCFYLKGKSHLAVRSGLPGTIRAVVRRDGVVAWDGLLGESDIGVDAGTSSVPFSIVFVMTNKRGFDPSLPDAAGAEFRFQGLTLDDDAALERTSETRKDMLFDFIGDSITAGVDVLGRSGGWAENSDVTLTYAFQLGERLRVGYRIRAFPGAGCDDISDTFPFFRKSMPLPVNPQPGIVFVNIAANDRAKETTHYRAQMRNLLDVIFVTYPKTRVVLLNFCRMTPNRLPVLKELARSFPEGTVSCFDARPYLVGYSDEGVHPDAESHRRLSDALADFVTQKLLQEPPEMAKGAARP